MRKNFSPGAAASLIFSFLFFAVLHSNAQTPAFPGAGGFGQFAKGARGVSNPSVYIVSNLNDSGPGSFRDAVSVPGRIVVFSVGGLINLASEIVVAPNTTIAGQTAPGDGIVLFGKRVTFTSSSNTICRYLRIRLGATGNSGKDASGLANGNNIIFDHMSFSWGMDEVFSINWDSKGTVPDNITIQNSIIGQGLHRENHSAGGLIQTPDGGKVSLLRNLYISNKTRNPKVKGVNEFVNNVVYDWGNGNRLGDNMNYGWSGEAYIMGGSAGVSEVNVINNYFMSGPLTPPSESTPFSRGTGTFYLYGSGNYFDKNKNGIIDGVLVPYDSTGYPGLAAENFRTAPFPYPAASPALTAEQAYAWICDSVGSSYPRRDQVDELMIDEVRSRGTKGLYVYRETDLPFSNGGVGVVFNAPAPLDSDADGMPDSWEDAHGLNKANAQDAVAFSTTHPGYLNIEVYINTVPSIAPPAFIKPPTGVTLSATSVELPAPSSTVNIQWTDNAGNEDHFILERSENGTSFTVIAQPSANAVSYQDANGLMPNKTYYYRLKAVNSEGSSAYTSVASVKTPPIPTAPAISSSPSPANGFQYVELSAGKVTLRWSGSSNTEKFTVYFGTNPSALELKAELPYAANAAYQVSALSDFTTYYWRVDATNNKGTAEGQLWSFRTSRSIPMGMAGYWSFNETDGRQVTDSSLFENHGVLGLDDDDQSIRVQGKVSNALDFATASTNMYVVSVPHQDQLYLDKSSFSLSFWMKGNPSHLPQDNNTSAYLLCKGSISRNATTGATGKRFDIEFKNRQFRFAIDDDNDAGGGGKDELQTDGTPFFTGNWVHVVAIRDTGSRRLKLYLNNVLVREQAITRALSGIGEASDLVIGNIGELEFLANTNAPAPYKGMLDELKIFNYALSPAEILEQFHTSPLPIAPYDPAVANGALLEGYNESIPLSWKGGYKTTAYKLFIGSSANNLSFVSDIALNNPSYTLNNLTPGTSYFWRVDAIGPEGTTQGPVWQFRAVSPKGLVGHWKLDEASGTAVADNSNYRQHGAITGMPEATWTAGKFGNGLQYKNPVNTGAVRVAHAEHLMFDQNAFSISLWVKLTSGASNYNSAAPAKDCYLIQKGQFTDPGGKWYGIQLRDSVLTFAIDDAAVKSNVDISLRKATAFHIFNNNWTNIVAIKDTSAKLIRLFINGVQAGTKAYTTNGTIGKIAPLLIGNSAENKPFHDIMDDVRLYNYALTAAEINALQTNTPLVAKATDPKPAHNAEVPYGDVLLQWKGKGQAYDLYFGSDPANLSPLAFGITPSEFNLPGQTTLGTYFWRVDVIRDGEKATGDVWTFTIADRVAPTVVTKNIDLFLDENGQASLMPSDLDNGSNDAYGISGYAIDRTVFDCSSAGAQQVILTVTDNNGNTASAPATVFVKDTIAPKALAKNITLTLTGGGVQLSAADLNNGSSDACGISSMSIDRASFGCNDIGVHEVVLKVTDVHGNVSTANATVTIDGKLPVPAITVSRTDATYTGGDDHAIYLGYGAQAITLNADDDSGPASYTWNPGTDLSSTTVAAPVFTPSQDGVYNFTSTATNGYGCSATASVTIKVVDVRCGNNGDKVLVCHNGAVNCIAAAAVPAHLAHGCSLGSCSELVTPVNARKAPPESGLEVVQPQVVPNPANTSIKVQWTATQSGSYNAEVFNAQGIRLMNLGQGTSAKGQMIQFSSNVSKLANGSYFIRISQGEKITVLRFIVQR
jgi:hypothetical protein